MKQKLTIFRAVSLLVEEEQARSVVSFTLDQMILSTKENLLFEPVDVCRACSGPCFRPGQDFVQLADRETRWGRIMAYTPERAANACLGLRWDTRHEFQATRPPLN